MTNAHEFPEFTPRPDARVKAVCFTGQPGGDIEKIRALASLGGGEIERVYRDPVLILRTKGRMLRLIHLDDWLTLSMNTGELTVSSDQAFRRYWH